jgi:hypothetical protein
MTAVISEFPSGTDYQVRTRTRLHLTRRGRRVLIALIVVPIIVAAFFAALNGGIADATNTSVADASVYVTVDTGETLWQIAERIAPTADPRVVIADISSYNHIQGQIQAGQRIAIPTQYQ